MKKKVEEAFQQPIKPVKRPPKRKRKPRQPILSQSAMDIRASRLRAVRPVEIHLMKRHSINCVYYGPGTVRVPSAVAAALLENEERARANERRFQDKERSVIVTPRGYGHRAIDVTPEVFETAWDTRPIGRISGKDFPQQ